MTKSSRPSSTQVVLTSLLVDVSDVVLNLSVALLSGSVVMTTQTLQGIADVTASGLTLIGVRRSRRPADSAHPFGYGRELYFWTVLAGLVMFTITTTLSFYLGLNRYLNPEPIENIGFALAVLAIGLCTNGYSFTRSYKRLLDNRRPGAIIHLFFNSNLVETKVAFILDVTGTMASLVGVVALGLYQLTGNVHFDAIGSMIISLLMGLLTLVLLINVKDLIIGRRASRETEKLIRQAALDIPEVLQLLDLRTSVVGSEQLLVNMEVHLRQGLKTRQIETIIDTIKAAVIKKVPQTIHIQVELETPE